MTDTTVNPTEFPPAADTAVGAIINPPVADDVPTETPEAAEEAEATRGSNTQLTLEEFEKDLKKFGKAYGAGMNSRPAMALKATQAAQQIAGVDDKKAKDFYTIFQTAAANAKGLEYKREASFGVQVSKLKNFLQLGAMPQVDGVEVLDMTVDIIEELSKMNESPLKGSAYDNMVKVAREQLKRPEEPLSEEEVRGLLTPDHSEKSSLDKLIDSYKRVRKLTETIDVEPLLEAQAKMGEAIQALGGEIPAEPEKKAKERQVAALIRRAKKDQAKLAALTGQNVSIADLAKVAAAFTE